MTDQTGRPQPAADRFARPELQDDYEDGYHQPPAVGIPRDRKAKDVDQLDLFATTDNGRRGSAIAGEVPR